MRVLLVTQLYPPEMGAQANRMYPFARELAAAGHQVSVATGMPNYPSGVVYPAYRGKRILREELDGAVVFRTHYYTAPRNQSRKDQARSYLSFVPAAYRSGLRAGKQDVVLVTSPPLFPVLTGMLLARRWGAKLVLDLRDLWPDELITYGGMSEKCLPVELLRRLEHAAYRNSHLICGTTHSILETVVARGASRDRVFLLPNGADLELFRPLSRDNEIARALNLEDQFTVMYSGLFGMKHGLEVLLQAAEILRAESRITFYLMGNGVRREALMDYVRRHHLTNIRFGKERPVQEVPFVLSRADACFAAMRPEPYPSKLISVKIFEYLACERPVICAANGETAEVIRRSGGGIAVPAGDAATTARAILDLYQAPERAAAMGRAGRRFVETHFSRQQWARELERVLHTLCEKAA